MKYVQRRYIKSDGVQDLNCYNRLSTSNNALAVATNNSSEHNTQEQDNTQQQLLPSHSTQTDTRNPQHTLQAALHRN